MRSATAAGALALTLGTSARFGAIREAKSQVPTDEFRTGTAVRPLDIINLHELEAEAEKIIPKGPFGYIAGGSGDEWTLKENVRAFDDVQIKPRYLTGIEMPSTDTTLLGAKVAVPIFVTPMAAHGLAHQSAERGSARGTGEAGALFCAQTLANVPLEDIQAATSGPKWFQLYYTNDPGVNRELIQRAKAIGSTAIVFTVDLEWPGNREADKRNGFAFPPHLSFPNIPGIRGGAKLADLAQVFKKDLRLSDIEFIRKESGLPVIVKGVLSPENARECVQHGAAAIQVSNHGGRQLDGVQAAITALPAIVEAVGGQVPVFLDSGIRRGTHIFKALALGAKGVAIGRPVLYGLALGGWQGVKSVFDTLSAELKLTMKLAGCARVEDISRRFLI
jgi:lactate oxidase